MDRPVNTSHGNPSALVLDPIIDGFHLTRVLMDGGSSLNLLYQDTVRKMGIDPSKIKSLLWMLSGEPKTTSSVIEPVQRASTLGITPLKVVLVGLILDGSTPILQTVS